MQFKNSIAPSEVAQGLANRLQREWSEGNYMRMMIYESILGGVSVLLMMAVIVWGVQILMT
jgi:hypothetical protein